MQCSLPSFAFNMEVKELAEEGMMKGKAIHRTQTNQTKCKEMATKLGVMEMF